MYTSHRNLDVYSGKIPLLAVARIGHRLATQFDNPLVSFVVLFFTNYSATKKTNHIA